MLQESASGSCGKSIFHRQKRAVKRGVEGIMAAYNEIDGVYCHRNAWLLRDVLRGEMGFDGIVMADGLAVDFLKNTEGDTLHARRCSEKSRCGCEPLG